MSKINVNGKEIAVVNIENYDYISLTDMVRDIENGSALIEQWLRNKNTIEFLGVLIPSNSRELKIKLVLIVLFCR